MRKKSTESNGPKIPCPVCKESYHRMGLTTHIKLVHPKWGGRKFESSLTQYLDRLHKQANAASTRAMRKELRGEFVENNAVPIAERHGNAEEAVETVEVRTAPSEYRKLRERVGLLTEQVNLLEREKKGDISELSELRDKYKGAVRLLIAEYEASCATARRLEFALRTLGVKLFGKHLPSVLNDVDPDQEY